MSDAESQIIAYLQQVVSEAGSMVKILPATALLGAELLDSIGLVALITFLEEKFDLQITDADLGPDLFETPASIAAFVDKQRA